MEKNKPENNSSSPYPREIPDLLSSEIKELYGLEIPENPGKEKNNSHLTQILFRGFPQGNSY
ncbi:MULTISPECIES: hypothetical protein [Chryseobacterium]|uniref:Uncharacterized protein n=1 Tax=Chryseobacterium geocarposphaerae TaxID=1416776 RepID=A0ABU1L986_9FLAO|nr:MULTISPECIES: hypothetical protein [Chryseobacterium]MDR6403140.1 hypothetical protein [Chryseobacterium geocarposphaerae]MDR6696695.1 hypothetical protein [Chryseobacterium ginsenosidimutans]